MKHFMLFNEGRSLLSRLVLFLTLILGGATSVWADTDIWDGSTLLSTWENSGSTSGGYIYTWTSATISSKEAVTYSTGQTLIVHAKQKTSGNGKYLKAYYYHDDSWGDPVNEWGNSAFSTTEDTYTINLVAGTYKWKLDISGIQISRIEVTSAGGDVPVLYISPESGADFGDVISDASSVYTITNNTGATVNVTPSITGTNANMFSVSPSDEREIADGKSQEFTVTFNWQADVDQLGDKTATITFTPDNGYAAFNISASATAKTAAVFDETSAPSYTSGTKSILIKYTPKNGWNTICLPITVGSGIFSDFMNNLFGSSSKAYKLASYEDNILGFTKVSSLETGNPYLVYVPTAADHPKGYFIETYISPSAAGSTQPSGTDAVFQGTYAPIAAGDFTTDMYGVTTAGEVRPGNGTTASMKGYRAYFTGISAPTSGAGVKMVILEDDGGETDLGFVKMVDENAKDVYTLTGQKVQKGRKGIYIVNGKKVVIK